jgi:hypothetical protein
VQHVWVLRREELDGAALSVAALLLVARSVIAVDGVGVAALWLGRKQASNGWGRGSIDKQQVALVARRR